MPKKSHTKLLSEWNDYMYLEHPTPYESKIAGIIERMRLKMVIDMCDIKKSDSVLEIGCESGQILSRVKGVKRLVGVDVSKMALSDANKRLDGQVELHFADFEKPIDRNILKKNSFDVIICSQILEHVADPKAVMDNIYVLAKKDARIVISVPNELFLLNLKKAISGLGVMNLLLPGIEPKISEWHLQIFTDKKVKELIRDSFDIVGSKRTLNIFLIYLLKKIG